jgi:hypothetical protein
MHQLARQRDNLWCAIGFFSQAVRLAEAVTRGLVFFMFDAMAAQIWWFLNTIPGLLRFAISFSLVSGVLNMSKCKILAGGYLDSSDNEKCLDPGLSQLKSAPYAPPCLIATSRSVSSSFQLPGSSGYSPRLSAPKRHVSVSSSSSRPTPVPESVQSTQNTPDIQTGTSLVYFV